MDAVARGVLGAIGMTSGACGTSAGIGIELEGFDLAGATGSGDMQADMQVKLDHHLQKSQQW